MSELTAQPCKPVEELLKDVTKQVSEYEALKLNELKSQLEAFVKKKQAAVDDYTKKYDELKRVWNEQGGRIENLRKDLKCAFPNDQWKELIDNTVCPLRADLEQAKAHIECRDACPGLLEAQRDKAKAEMESAQATVAAWEAASQRIDAQLKDNQKVIDEVGRLMQGPDRVIGLYLLWFKLMPAHSQLGPSDEALFPGESPEELCGACAHEKRPKKERCRECWPEEQTLEERTASSGGSRRVAPWLIDKSRYSGKLDSAWCDYRAAKDAFAKMETAFREAPDDLPTKKEQYEDNKKTLDDRVKQKLKEALGS